MNLDTYASEMAKSVWDKAFFMDKIPGAKCIIDFGCADGAMIRMLAPFFPNTTFYGYDINDELIIEAWRKLKSPADKDTFFFHKERSYPNRHDSFEDMIAIATQYYQPDEVCINLSSVLHEVFSSSPSGKKTIQHLVEKLQPKYITIRDMYWHATSGVNRLRCSENQIRKQAEEKYLNDYETTFGFIHSPRSITHFLMKYQWKNNGWNDEMKENYFSYTMDDFLDIMCRWQYTTVFESHYQLPYLTEKWKKEYGFFVPEAHTHAQFILRRND